MRLFFALELTDPVRDRAVNLQEELKRSLPDPSYRWTKPELFHVTLAFLGKVDPEHLPRLKQIAKAVCSEHPCTELRFSGLGTFGTPRRPRVLFMGANEFTGNNTLNGVGYELYSRCSEFLDIDTSNRIIPHVTFGRLMTNVKKGLTTAVASVLVSHAESHCGEMSVNSIILMKSNLGRSEARYELIDRFPLRG